MARVDITIDGAHIAGGLRGLVADAMPNTIAGKQDAMNHTMEQWIRLAQGTFSHSTGQYINGIGQREPSPFTGVIYNTAKHAAAVERGHGQIDQRKALQTSTKTRWMMTKEGYLVKSLIIPFRHNIPGNSATAPAMPQAVYKMAKSLAPTLRTASAAYLSMTADQAKALGKRSAVPPSPYTAFQGATVKRASYDWGGRLKGVGGNYEGMTRMANGGGYVTFRVMHERSEPDKWIIPARSGDYLARRAAEQSVPVIKQKVSEGFFRDLGLGV